MTTSLNHAQRPEKVCIIGAGPCGITAAKNLIDANFSNIVIFEKNNAVGGNWLYSSDTDRHASVYETTHLVSSKTLSGYADFPLPDHYPDFPSHIQMLEYFQAYSRHFDVDRLIQFNTLVNHAGKGPDGRWRITTKKINHAVETRVFDYLVVCNGHHWNPKLPSYKGSFSGEFLHSHFYSHVAPFKGKRILVIGGGNSACDIAVETCRIAKTDISIRHGGWYMPKLLFGLPTDVLYGKLQWLPKRLQQFCLEWAIRLHIGPWDSYGLPQPQGRVYETTSVYNSDLLQSIRHGKMGVRPGIERLEGRCVHFSDGSVGEYDTIIAATGFNIKFPFFDENIVNADAPDFQLAAHMLHPHHNDLFFIGLCQPSGCVWVISELQSKVMARQMQGKINLAYRFRTETGKMHTARDEKFSLHIDYPSYRKLMLKLLGFTRAVQPLPASITFWHKTRAALGFLFTPAPKTGIGAGSNLTRDTGLK